MHESITRNFKYRRTIAKIARLTLMDIDGGKT